MFISQRVRIHFWKPPFIGVGALVFLVLFTGTPTFGKCVSSDSSDSEKARYDGIDYFHFWVIPRAQRDPEIKSVYFKSEHPKLRIFAETQTEIQNSDALFAHLKKNSELYESQFEPTGSPFLYTITGLMQTGRFPIDYQVFQWISNIACVIGVVLIGRVFELRTWLSIVLALSLFLVFKPLQIDVSVANVNRIQLFIFGMFALFLSRNNVFLAGAVMGAAIAFKLNFAFALAFAGLAYLISRQWVPLMYIVCGAIAGTSAGFFSGAMYFGSMECWLEWRRYLEAFMSKAAAIELGNYSLQALIRCNSTYLAFGILIAVMILACIKKQVDEMDHKGVIHWATLGLLSFLISSPLVWSHYFVLAIPSIVLFVSHSRASGSFWRNLILVLAVLLLSGTFAKVLTQIQVAVTLQLGLALLLFISLDFRGALEIKTEYAEAELGPGAI